MMPGSLLVYMRACFEKDKVQNKDACVKFPSGGILSFLTPVWRRYHFIGMVGLVMTMSLCSSLKRAKWNI